MYVNEKREKNNAGLPINVNYFPVVSVKISICIKQLANRGTEVAGFAKCSGRKSLKVKTAFERIFETVKAAI